jgi:hypothetical protein
LSGNNPGGNPGEADSRGQDGTTVADTFAGLISAFDSASEDLDRAVAEPGIKGSFAKFFDNNEQTVRDVQRFGLTMTNNVRSGASQVASTDVESAQRYNRVDGFQHVRPAARVDPDSSTGSLLNRHVNGDTERYLPGD